MAILENELASRPRYLKSEQDAERRHELVGGRVLPWREARNAMT
jgi:hypothetical protein